jgi:hypothetical protein
VRQRTMVSYESAIQTNFPRASSPIGSPPLLLNVCLQDRLHVALPQPLRASVFFGWTGAVVGLIVN